MVIVGNGTRKRGFQNAKDSDVVRAEVRDILARNGEVHGVPDERARDIFFHYCKSGCKARNIPFFPIGANGERAGFNQALKRLLKEQVSYTTDGRGYTGVNNQRTLDIWRAGIDRACGRLEPALSPAREETEVLEPEAEAYEEPEEIGVKVFAEKKAEPVERNGALSMRVLNAFLQQDQEEMMYLLLEIDELTGGR